MASPAPKKIQVSQLKSKILRPALTSHFLVYIKAPGGGFNEFLIDNGLNINDTGDLYLMCSETTLPGSSFSTHESNNDFHGTTERFAYRRLYDDRIDLSFYVDADNHLPIRFFETWMKYISNESIAELNGVSTKGGDYFYRFRYPDGANGYRQDSALEITKFERHMNNENGVNLKYEFIKPYPISIQSMPVSYDTSSLLKCTVSMNYIRYIVDPRGDDNKYLKKELGGNTTNLPFADQPPIDATSAAAFNSLQFGVDTTNRFQFGNDTTTNGIFSRTGNSINVNRVNRAFSGQSVLNR